MLSAIIILEGLFDKVGNKLAIYKDHFIQLFTDGFQSQNKKIKYACLNCVLTLVIEFKAKSQKEFKVFGNSILTIIAQLVIEKEEDQLKKSIEKVEHF